MTKTTTDPNGNGKIDRLDGGASKMQSEPSERAKSNGAVTTHRVNGSTVGAGSRQNSLMPMELFAAHLQRAVQHLCLGLQGELLKGTTGMAQINARALMLVRCPHEAAVSLAVKQYQECVSDLASFERIANSLDVSQRKDLILRGKRQVERQRRNLAELGVEIRNFEKGVPFDPEYHDVVGQEATSLQDKLQTIARAETPAFVWRDEFRQQQVIPAKVTVYAHLICEECAKSARTDAAA